MKLTSRLAALFFGAAATIIPLAGCGDSDKVTVSIVIINMGGDGHDVGFGVNPPRINALFGSCAPSKTFDIASDMPVYWSLKRNNGVATLSVNSTTLASRVTLTLNKPGQDTVVATNPNDRNKMFYIPIDAQACSPDSGGGGGSTTVTISPAGDTITLIVGQSMQLFANPTNVTWSATGCSSVNSTGLVMANAVGTGQVKATLTTNSGIFGVKYVKCVGNTEGGSVRVTLSCPTSITVGQTSSCTGTGFNLPSGETLWYSSSDPTALPVVPERRTYSGDPVWGTGTREGGTILGRKVSTVKICVEPKNNPNVRDCKDVQVK